MAMECTVLFVMCFWLPNILWASLRVSVCVCVSVYSYLRCLVCRLCLSRLIAAVCSSEAAHH